MPLDELLNRRRFLKTTGSAAVVTAFAGCSGDGDGDGAEDGGADDTGGDGMDDTESDGEDGTGGEANEIVITQGQFIETPDPNDHITSPYYNIFDQVYEPLFTITPDIEIEAGVVEEWEPTGDGATDLTIRDDVVFHNGEDLTAEDVAWSMRRIIDPELGPASDQAFGVPNITGAEAVDETTVRIEHPDVSPTLAEFQYGQFIRALKRDWVEQQETSEETGSIIGDSAEAFNGTGPYEVVEYVPDTRIVLERFDDYWGEEPSIDRITFNEDPESSGRVSALQTGETDLVDNVLPDDVPDVDDADGIEIRNETSFRSIFLVMKEGVEPFDSQEFRQAMNYAVDNQGIIDTILSGFGEPMTQMHAEGIFGYNPDLDPYEQDQDQAEQLVEESGYAGVDITLSAPQGRYLNDAAVAETAANQIDQLENVNCEVDIREFPVISDAASTGLDGAEDEDERIPFFLIGWGVITGDANYGISPWIEPEGALQSLDAPDIWERLQESQQEQDTDAREQMLQEINADLREEAPFVFLHSQDSIYGVNSDLQWEPRQDESIFAWEIE